MNEIFTRRSVRQYQDKPVARETAERLLKAAMQAPSAGNQRPWEFIVVDDKEMLKDLARTSPYAGPVQAAPMAIVVLANKEGMKFPENWQADLSAATENLLLEAVHLGLGAVWLGIAPLPERMEQVSRLFSLPNTVQPFAIVPVGYTDKGNTFVDRFEAHKVHYGKY